MKFNVFILIVTLVGALAGCSHDEIGDDIFAKEVLYKTQVEFLLGENDVSASGDNASSVQLNLSDQTFVPDGMLLPQNEPPRKIFSSNNWQQVNDVRIYVFRKNSNNNFVYYKPLDDNGVKQNYLSVENFTHKFDISPYVVWWGGADDTNEAHSFIGHINLPEGEYRFLALARDDQTITNNKRLMDPNIAMTTWGWQSWIESTTRLETATLACARNTELSTTELFSGYTTESLIVNNSKQNFFRTITLHRAVAGILLYVEHIPATIRISNCDSEATTNARDIPVKSIAVVHGKVLSDQVSIANRQAIAGRLAVTSTSVTSQLPLPRYFLIKADIPAQAQVQNGIYVNLSPNNTAHPNALLKGAFVMPQQANQSTSSGSEKEKYDKSLYLVLLGYDSYLKQEIALEWRPIRFANADDENCDPFHFPILANHFYSIGHRVFSADGGSPAPGDDLPIDLREATSSEIIIQLNSSWNEYYGGELGNSIPGLALDPEWGEHQAGELLN